MTDVDSPLEAGVSQAAERRNIPWLWLIVAAAFAGAVVLAVITSRPPMVEEVMVYRILVRVDPRIPDDETRAKEKIARVREELLVPGTGFSAVALREDETENSRSNDPGGLGWARRGTLADPALELILFSLDVDEISEIYRDEEGFSVFTITQRRKVAAR